MWRTKAAAALKSSTIWQQKVWIYIWRFLYPLILLIIMPQPMYSPCKQKHTFVMKHVYTYPPPPTTTNLTLHYHQTPHSVHMQKNKHTSIYTQTRSSTHIYIHKQNIQIHWLVQESCGKTWISLWGKVTIHLLRRRVILQGQNDSGINLLTRSIKLNESSMVYLIPTRPMRYTPVAALVL